MIVIAGLGNPGMEYMNTRHNVGFNAIDLIADMYNIKVDRVKFKGVCGEGNIKGEKIMLLKPTTYMNLSGESLRSLMDFYKLESNQIIVIYDDISLPIGRLRVKEKGSAGGHNGIKSIINHLGTDVFARIKIGVGAPKGNLVNHVLGKFTKEEENILKDVLKVVVQAAERIVEDSPEKAMNEFNGFISNKLD